MLENKLALEPQQLEVLIFAPTGQDASLLADALMREKIESRICRKMTDLCDRLQTDSGAVLVADEALSPEAIKHLKGMLNRQEAWSDIPIVVMTGGGQTSSLNFEAVKEFTPSGNITLLERLFKPITLISSLQVALRARRRQYQVRDLLQLQIQATRIRDEFISIASHELKTPLTSLKLQTQISARLLKRGDPAALSMSRVKKLVDSTSNQVDRLTRLVEDMLDVSRINSGKMVLQITHFDLSDLVRELVDHFMLQLAAVSCDVTVHAPEDVHGSWDRYRIEQVINNLLTNAIRYSPGKPVAITVSKAEELARITVQDQGDGIAPEHQDRIFQRFERAVLSDNISGLGLGLYICREILLSHQGRIRVESELGKGATFIVELPIRDLETATAPAQRNQA